MNDPRWTDVDHFLADQFIPATENLDHVLESSARAGLPAIAVSPTQGKFLHLLVRLTSARRVLEIGTLGGYSTIWMARALPADGRLTTLEFDPRHAEVARANIAEAGLADRVVVRIGRAIDLLPLVEREGEGPFDIVFIDADKAGIPEYFDWAIRLSRPGTLVVVDNVVRDGKVTDASSTDPNIVGVRRFLALVANDPRVSGTALQTVGAKGYDGVALLVVN